MSEHKPVFVAWQSPESREWHVVGKLTQKDSLYSFKYLKGSQFCKGFIPFSGMKDLSKTYFSEELFPLFKNRVLSKKRPEYPKFLDWLALDDHTDISEIDMLGRSGGLRSTDTIQLFTTPSFDRSGSFEHDFFAHGLRHLSKSAKERVASIKEGETLKLCLDIQNSHDRSSIIIRASNPSEIIGYCPRYLAEEVHRILLDDSSTISTVVKKFSNDAPAYYQLMCTFKGNVNPKLMTSLIEREEFREM